jgi:putative ABC transport system permease protein
MRPWLIFHTVRRRFGEAGPIVEVGGRSHSRNWFEPLAKDLTFAVRSLARCPGYASAVIATLAIGIGAPAAILNLARQILVPALPFRDKGRIDEVSDYNVRRNQPSVIFVPRFLAIREKATSFARLAAMQWTQANLVAGGLPAPVSVISVTPDFFEVLNTPALLGRVFAPEEYSSGVEAMVVVLSHDLWARQFQSDPGVLGGEVLIGGVRRQVVGIMPDGFRGPRHFPDWDVVLPMPRQDLEPSNGRWIGLWLLGRLKPGVSLGQAQAEVATIRDGILPKEWATQVTPRVIGFGEAFRPGLANAAWVFVGAMLLLYVIACANALNLILVRTVSRRGELGVRLALGGGRSRIVRLLLVENLCLTGVAGTAGALLAYWGCVLFAHLLPGSWRVVGEVKPDGPGALVVALAVTLLTAATACAWPAWVGGMIKVQDALKPGNGGGGESRQMWNLRSGLIVVQAAMSVILLVGAGLMVRSFVRLRQVGVGFETARKYSVTTRLPFYGGSRASAGDFAGIVERVTDGLARLPVVRNAAVADILPMAGGGIGGAAIKVDGGGDAEAVEAPVIPVSPGYFSALGQPLIAGHEFVGLKRGDPPVVVISESLARRLFPNANPIGRRLDMGETARWRPVGKSDQTQREQWEIVGVAGDVHENGPRQKPWASCYIPFWQRSAYSTFQFAVLLQLAGRPGSLFRDRGIYVTPLTTTCSAIGHAGGLSADPAGVGAPVQRRIGLPGVSCGAAVAGRLRLPGLPGATGLGDSSRPVAVLGVPAGSIGHRGHGFSG